MVGRGVRICVDFEGDGFFEDMKGRCGEQGLMRFSELVEVYIEN